MALGFQTCTINWYMNCIEVLDVDTVSKLIFQFTESHREQGEPV